MSDTMSQDPYAVAASYEEKEAIYQQLLSKHEQSEYERRKVIYSDLIADWKHHRNIQQDIDRKCHKSLLVIAAGSFGVSFAFISQIVDLRAENMPLLVASWVFFALTIVLAILELKIGSTIQDMLLNNVEKNLERGYRGEPYLQPKRWLIMWPSRIISWLSVVTFIIGVSWLIYFVHQSV